MPRLLAIAGLRLLFCAVMAYVLWRLLGAVGLVVSAPLFGVLLARPILEMSAELRDSARTLAYSPVEGRHFEHRGFRLDIVEDDRHHRWVSVNDVRKVIAQLPREAVLLRQFPEGLRDDPAVRGQRIHADVLLAYLARSTEGDSVRFRNWLEREVVLPAAKIRQRLGIKDAVPSSTNPPSQAP
jgi:hypothetical protein